MARFDVNQSNFQRATQKVKAKLFSKPVIPQNKWDELGKLVADLKKERTRYQLLAGVQFVLLLITIGLLAKSWL